MASLNKCILEIQPSPEDKARLREMTADLVRQGEDPAEAGLLAAQELHGQAQEQHQAVVDQLGQSKVGFVENKDFEISDSMYRDPEPALLEQSTEPFYSELTRQVEALNQPKAPAKQWMGMIRKLAKQDEIAWSGVEDWLSDQEGSISKDDLVTYLNSQEVQIDEVVNGESVDISDLPEGSNISLNEDTNEYEIWLGDANIGIGSTEEAAIRDALNELSIANATEGSTALKFAKYQMPGEKEGYREFFVTAPNQAWNAREEFNKFNEQIKKRYPEFSHSVDGATKEEKAKYDKLNKAAEEEADLDMAGKLKKDFSWRDGHSEYSDVVNPIARIRFNERMIDGKRTLFIEEIQNPQAEQTKKMPEFMQKPQFHVTAAIKRMVRYAADNGLEQISWTPGDVQADRYDLSKQVDSIGYRKDGEDTWEISAIKDGESVLTEHGKTIAQLEEIVGKGVAKKITEGEGELRPGKGGVRDLSGLDLKVGGEGLKKLYDEIVPRLAGKFAKKFGGKVTTSETQEGQEVWTLPIGDKLRNAALEGLPLFQGTRATFKRATALDPRRIIKLNEISDLSSFLHESAHLFLDMEQMLAEKYGITENQQRLLDWLGVTSFDQITDEHHEKFAETYEVYLREGKSPSLKLREAFAAFSRWLTKIYATLADPRLNRAKLDSEIREIFDRMLATQAEIDAAISTPAYEQYFRSKEQSGMSDAEWEKYQKQIKTRDSKVQLTLEEKVLKELRDRKTREWREEKAPLILEELERFKKLRVYQVLRDINEYKMDYDGVVEIYGKIPGKMIGKAKKGGLDPNEYADHYGWGSAKTMLSEIDRSPTLKMAADQAAELRMVAKHGDLLNDGSIELEAAEALHSDQQAEVLLTELRALRKQSGVPEINRELLKSEARIMIGKMMFSQIKPSKYYRNEIRAAKRAVTADDSQVALDAKIQQLANHYLYREAVQVKEDMLKRRKRIKKVQTQKYSTKQVDKDYIANMKALASLYDLRTNPERMQAAGDVIRWVNDQMEIASVAMWDINLLMMQEATERNELDKFTLPTFDDLTAEQLRGVDDMIRHLRYVGGRMADSVKAELAEDRQRFTDSLIDNGGKDVKDSPGIPDPLTGKIRQWNHMINKLPSLRNLVRKMDGFDEYGVGYEMIYKEVEKGNDRKLDLSREMYERFTTDLDGIHKIGLSKLNKIDYDLENGGTESMGSEHRFMLGLYWGTESSREAIRDAWGMTDIDVSKILSDLTQEQLAVMNTVWKLNESMWPQLSEAGFKRDGVVPPKLEATPFEVNGVKMTGGHMRLIYDSTRLELKGAQEEAKAFASVMPIKAASLHARVGAGGAKPMLDVNNIGRAINDNIHYIAFAETGDRLRSIINAKEVRGVIERKHGTGFYKALVETLTSISGNHDERGSIPFLSSAFRLLRRAATAKHLMYSVRNTLQQVSAAVVAGDEVGYGKWLSMVNKMGAEEGVKYVGALTRMQSPQGHAATVNFVLENSAFMRNRASLVNREASEHLREMVVDTQFGHVWRVFAQHGFTPQTIVDAMIAFPTWMVRYEQAMETHGDHETARSQANTAVAETVGSGSDLHLGGAFQTTNTEFVKTFTIFGTWFNAYYQRMYKATKGGTDLVNMEIPKAFIVVPFAVAMIEAVATLNYPGDEDDWADRLSSGEFWLHMGKRYASFMAGTMPIMRDVAGAFSGYAPKTVFGGGAETPAKFAGEIDALIKGRQTPLKAVSDVTKIITTIVPVPGAGNMSRLMDYADSFNQGKEREWSTYQAFVEGPQRNR